MSKPCNHCARAAKARGLCNAHYKSWKKYGDPLAAKPTPRGDRVAQFWAKVDRQGPGECWPWLAGKTPRGYAAYADGNGHTMRAYIFSWELHYGPRPAPDPVDPWTIHHTCHTPDCTLGDECPHRACVNPAHLQLVRNSYNVSEGASFSAVNARKTRCDYGHLLEGENIYPGYERRICVPCARRRAREAAARKRSAYIAAAERERT